MPKYDLRCPQGHTFEIKRTYKEFDEGFDTSCPECGEASSVILPANPFKLSWIDTVSRKNKSANHLPVEMGGIWDGGKQVR